MHDDEHLPLAKWLALELAPTILGSKPATILCLRNVRFCPLFSLWKKYQTSLLANTSIQYLSLRTTMDTEIVLFYRENLLKRCLRRRCCRQFLARRGYPVDQGIKAVLQTLQLRFSQSCPHEVGIILGIPLKDVIGFMEVRCPLDIIGQWKVYGCKESSLRIMRCYANDRIKMEKLLPCLPTPCEIFNHNYDTLQQLLIAA